VQLEQLIGRKDTMLIQIDADELNARQANAATATKTAIATTPR
jgi:hypothetical protein